MRHIILLFVSVSFILVSCSEESIQDITAEEIGVQEETNSMNFAKSNENLTSNFLPTFTNYHGRDRGTSTNRSASLASEWIHEYDDNGKLVKSYFFELFPYRILKEVNYSDIGENQKLTYEIKEYTYFRLNISWTTSYELMVDQTLNIKRITPDQGRTAVFEELNDQGWVTTIHTVTSDNKVLYKSGYEYDETGKVLKYLAYDTPGVESSTVDYTYNEHGDPLSYHYQNTKGAEIKVEYYYREDNTLERLEEEYYNDPDDFGTKIYTYTSEERFLKQIVNKGDGSKEMVIYDEDEVVVEYFKEDDVLSEVYTYHIQDDGYLLKLYKKYLNGVIHMIKYYDADGELDYTEYYDENGKLTETVYE